MYKCCIFDLDGTLVDSLESIAYTSNLTMKKYGFETIETNKFKYFVGDGYKVLIEKCLKEVGDTELKYYDQALITYEEYFEEYCLYHVRPYDGILEMLNTLKSNQVKLAVLSNKPHDRTIDTIRGIFGDSIFDRVGGHQAGIKKKPDPQGALLTAKELGMLPEECLYIGDTNTDMKTGLASGMDTMGVTWGFRERKELEAFSPKYLIDQAAQITQIVLNQ